MLSKQDLLDMKQQHEKIVVLTAYDASFTKQLEAAGVDVLLVGDSLGMVVQGHDSTLPVTMQDMLYHTELVVRGRESALLVSDMPYHSYNDKNMALENARQFITAGADMVKLEGANSVAETMQYLTKNAIRVCGHLGLLPQSVNELGGYKVQGRDAIAAEQMITDAQLLESVGVEMIVLECIPHVLAKRISESISIPTIGIGAGVDCDGQVLVTYDLLGITFGKPPKFSEDFMARQKKGATIQTAVTAFVKAVKDGSFPSLEQSFE